MVSVLEAEEAISSPGPHCICIPPLLVHDHLALGGMCLTCTDQNSPPDLAGWGTARVGPGWPGAALGWGQKQQVRLQLTLGVRQRPGPRDALPEAEGPLSSLQTEPQKENRHRHKSPWHSCPHFCI